MVHAPVVHALLVAKLEQFPAWRVQVQPWRFLPGRCKCGLNFEWYKCNLKVEWSSLLEGVSAKCLALFSLASIPVSLQWVFLPDPSIRKRLTLPPKVQVDYRAACFCHRQLIDIGFVCSVCLSSKPSLSSFVKTRFARCTRCVVLSRRLV